MRARIAAAVLAIVTPMRMAPRSLETKRSARGRGATSDDSRRAQKRRQSIEIIAKQIEDSKRIRDRSHYRSEKEIDEIARDVERRAKVTYDDVTISAGEAAIRGSLSDEGRFFYEKAIPAVGRRVFLEPRGDLVGDD